MGRGRGHGLLRDLYCRHGVDRDAAPLGTDLQFRSRHRWVSSAVALLAHPHPRSGAVLPCVPRQPLAGLRRVCRHRDRLRGAPGAMAAMATTMIVMRFSKLSGRLGRGIGRLRKVALCAALLCAPSVAHAAEATAERVSFESFDIDPQTGQPITISALYFKPATHADHAPGRTPAVVALHGCGGMYSEAAARRNRLTQRHQAMADLLVAEGYAVLFPDSFNPRGRREICSLKLRDQEITQDKRRLDVLAALGYLRTRPDVDRSRVALLGWSHGGSAVLATMNRRHPVVAQFLAAETPADRFFRTAIAFYPGCYESVYTRFGYAPSSSVGLFTGGAR